MAHLRKMVPGASFRSQSCIKHFREVSRQHGFILDEVLPEGGGSSVTGYAHFYLGGPLDPLYMVSICCTISSLVTDTSSML